jgi:lysophospholipase L1-like esterase
MPRMERLPVALAALLLALLVPSAAQAAVKHHQPTRYYVSLGDSYASGYQPTHGNTLHGYANQLLPLARHRRDRLQLVNFGCAGATTTSIIHSHGCPKAARAIHGPAFHGRTQAAAAERFMRAHRGRIGLVTVSIGGNDVTACARDSDPFGCVNKAIASIKKNVKTLMRGVRKAAGPKAEIVGLTYPDVILGEWVAQPPNQGLAKVSVGAFKSLINPALKARYKAVHGKFVDVTAKTGAYGSLDDMTTLAPYGSIPVPVAKVCTLTFFCERGDIHPHTSGYALIAKLIAKLLP